jgi:MYXO-CTERM domain-containing protein
LGPDVWVPARLTRGELSVDGGSWQSGWVWVKNGSELWLQADFTDSDLNNGAPHTTLTIGGVLAPTNPTLPLGNVLTVSFAAGVPTVINPKVAPAPAAATVTVSSSASSSGGSVEAGLLALLALLGTRHLRRRRAIR